MNNHGQLLIRFKKDFNGNRKNLHTGTASLYYKLGRNLYVIITCAHNFLRMIEIEGEETKVYYSDARFMLHRDGLKKCTNPMKVVESSLIIHPKYLQKPKMWSKIIQVIINSFNRT